MSDPNRAQAYADTCQTDPVVYSQVNKAITANALGTWDPPASGLTEQVHNELKGMETTDRDRFANNDLMQYYGGMPAVQLNQLRDDQAGICRGDPASTPPADVRRYNAAVGRLDQAMQQWSANNKDKLPDDGEIMQIGMRNHLEVLLDRVDRIYSSETEARGVTITYRIGGVVHP